MEKNDFLPKTLLQWIQALSLIIGIAVILHNYFDKFSCRFLNIERRLDRIVWTMKKNGLSIE